MDLPIVAFFATGGTIASEPTASYGPTGFEMGYSTVLKADDLLTRVPDHTAIAKVEPTDFSQIGSHDMTPRMVVSLCREVNGALARPDVQGVVITHGTATLEDTCFLADLLVKGDKPVIGTGAMATASSPNWDGGRNILDSLTAAAAPESRGKGVMVCANGELHSARDVVKAHASSPAAFESPGFGPLGWVDEGRLIYYRSPVRRYTFPTESIEEKVEVVKVVQGCNDSLFRAALQMGVRGIVLEGLAGRGVVPTWFLPVIREAQRDGVVVVLCDRVIVGRVAFIGGTEMYELEQSGVISGGDLRPHKARLLLMAALAHTRDLEEVRSIFAAFAP